VLRERFVGGLNSLSTSFWVERGWARESRSGQCLLLVGPESSSGLRLGTADNDVNRRGSTGGEPGVFNNVRRDYQASGITALSQNQYPELTDYQEIRPVIAQRLLTELSRLVPLKSARLCWYQIHCLHNRRNDRPHVTVPPPDTRTVGTSPHHDFSDHSRHPQRRRWPTRHLWQALARVHNGRQQSGFHARGECS